MSKIPYRISLSGLDAPDGTISMAELRDLCTAVLDGAARALRLRDEGISVKSGTPPAWIRRATDFLVRGLDEGSTVVDIEAPMLSDALLFEGIDARDLSGVLEEHRDATALTFLIEAVHDIEACDTESERYDRGVLDALLQFQPFLRDETAQVKLFSPERPEEQLVLNRSGMATVAQLRRKTPDVRAILLVGFLDTISHQGKRFTVRTEDGLTVRGTFAEGERLEDQLRVLWGKPITLQGMAHYTPAGKIRLIEASSLRATTPGDIFLERAVQPMLPRLEEVAFPNAHHALADIWGKWPGDESIDELLDALRNQPEPGA